MNHWWMYVFMFGLNFQESEISAGNVKKDLPRVDSETRLFVDLQPMPSVKCPEEGHRAKCNSQEELAFPGPLLVSASSGFAWAGQRVGDAYGRSDSRSSSKSHFSCERNSSNIENIKSKLDYKGQENVDVHVGSKGHVPYELAKCAMLNRWTQLDHPESFDSSDAYYSQEMSEALCKGDPSSMRHNNLVCR